MVALLIIQTYPTLAHDKRASRICITSGHSLLDRVVHGQKEQIRQARWRKIHRPPAEEADLYQKASSYFSTLLQGDSFTSGELFIIMLRLKKEYVAQYDSLKQTFYILREYYGDHLKKMDANVLHYLTFTRTTALYLSYVKSKKMIPEEILATSILDAFDNNDTKLLLQYFNHLQQVLGDMA